MDWPDFKMYDIIFETREDFNRACELRPTTTDIGHSDRVLRFDTAQNAEEWAQMFEMRLMRFSRRYANTT